MRHKATRPGRLYAAIPNDMLRNPSLSLEARGMLALMMTFSDEWTFRVPHLQSVSGLGRDRLRAVLRELQEAGHLRRVLARDPATGKMGGSQWLIVDEPAEQGPRHRPPENPSVGATDRLKIRPPVKPTAGETDRRDSRRYKKTNRQEDQQKKNTKREEYTPTHPTDACPPRRGASRVCDQDDPDSASRHADMEAVIEAEAAARSLTRAQVRAAMTDLLQTLPADAPDDVALAALRDAFDRIALVAKGGAA